jgi:creatinine amidohydrolase
MTTHAAPWGHYERLRPAQIDAIRREVPVAYLPWGALEWHSYHNPIGLDGMKAHGLLTALAQRCGGIVLPPVYIGTDTIKPFKGFPHTIEHAQELVTALMREFLEQLVDERFEAIVFLTGHYGGRHVEAQKNATQQFLQKHPGFPVWAFADWQPLEGHYPMNHAAHGETSLQMHLVPGLVDLSLLPTDREATLDDDGVWGIDPRTATAADGAAMTRTFVEQSAPRVAALLEAARARRGRAS